MVVGNKAISILAGMKLRQTISEDAPQRHQGKQGTPMMGGLIILLGTAIGVAAGWVSDPRAKAVILMTLAFGGIGFLDDIMIATRGKNLGLKARQKLAAQFILAILFVVWISASRTFPTSLFLWNYNTIDIGPFYYIFAVLLIVGMSNAVNLTDGLDGLAGGLTTIVGITLGMVVLGARGAGSSLVVLSWALAGGCLGFLWYNTNPARVFMGDTGSLAIGAALAGIAIAAQKEVFILLIGAIFVIEALSVIIQVISFKTTGKRVFKMTPIHHHFELSGWAEQKIVVRFWILQVLISAVVLAWLGVFRLWN